jgi:hypothetical protein
MRQFSYVLCLLLAVATSGCFEMLEDVYVNADGSGQYQLTMDMSSMLEEGFMGDMMKQGMKEEMGVDKLEIDSLISLTDFQEGGLPSSLTEKDRAMLNRTEVRLRMSEADAVGKVVIKFPFTSMEELNDFQQTFAKLNENGGEGAGMGGLMSSGAMTGSNSRWSLSGRTLKREVDSSESKNMMDGMDEETMGMMKMFMADATFTTVYHLPGSVKKCTIDQAKVDGKTVTVSYGFLDMLEKTPNTSGDIKFKSN